MKYLVLVIGVDEAENGSDCSLTFFVSLAALSILFLPQGPSRHLQSSEDDAVAPPLPPPRSACPHNWPCDEGRWLPLSLFSYFCSLHLEIASLFVMLGLAGAFFVFVLTQQVSTASENRVLEF